MSRINTNVSSLLAQRILGDQNQSLTKALERLSTGVRVNRGADDPAGLIASEKLRSEKAALAAAVDNAERADQVLNVAEGGLQEVSTLLVELQSLITESSSAAGLSTEEKEANQLQVDAILQTIDRIAATTTFQGTKVLNGSFDFQVSGVDNIVSDFSVHGAKISDGSNVDVQLIVTNSAQHAGLFLSAGAAALDLTAASSTFVLEIAGTVGTREFTFSSGTSLTDAAASINNFKGVTGIAATASGNGIVLKSTEYGADQFVSVKVQDDGGQAGGIYNLDSTNENAADTSGPTAYSAASSPIRDDGQHLGSLVNGITARGKGNTAIVNSDDLNVSLTLSTTGAQTLGATNALSITGGGAQFNLGPTADLANQVRLGIRNVAARNVGATTVGTQAYHLSDLASGRLYNVIDGDNETGQQILNNAIDQISSLRGRLGAFQDNVIGSTINSLNVAFENISAAESAIRDTDFAAETAALTRAQILVAAATSALAIANANPQNVLSLLG